MQFEKKHAYLLLGVALWMVITWSMFIKNLSAAYADGEVRPDGYWIAHSILIVVNLIIAVILGTLGWKALKATNAEASLR
jgi:hypothetical protein